MSDFDFFNHHPIPTWIFSTNTFRFLAVNEAMLKIYGYSREELLGMTIEQIRPVEDWPRLRTFIVNRERGEHPPSNWRHLTSDGTIIDVEIQSTAVEFHGEPARLVAARNITGVCEAVEKFNLALSAGNFAIWEYSLADGILQWDPGLSGVYGIDRELFPKDRQEFLSMVEPEFRETMEEAFDRCVVDGEPYDCEFRIAMPGRGTRWRHAVGKRVDDSAGTPVKIIGIGTDITQRKNLEAQLHRSQKLEAVGRLASGIAHDFNNILTVITGYASLIRNETLPCDLIDAATEISVASDRAARLVKQLLEFSRTVPVSPQTIEVNDAVSKALAMIRRLIPESIRLRFNQNPIPVSICADPGQMDQLVMNICLNARDALHDGGTLTVSISTITDDFVSITITDTGAGMSPEVQERIFEPFFTTKEFGSGCGLGLSIVHGIVKQLNGTIDVQTELGQGTALIIQLPIVKT